MDVNKDLLCVLLDQGSLQHSYRLFQVVDFISTMPLLELKQNYKELSKSELKFIDSKHLKKNYLKVINKKEIN